MLVSIGLPRSREILVCFPLICMVTYIYGHTYSKSMDQTGKVANPARGQLNRENEYFPVRVILYISDA